MYLVLTDVLTCPRCGPEQGLIVLTDRMEGRRILEGALGCPICESKYPIHGGLADLRTMDQAPGPEPEKPGSESDAMRYAALLGIEQGPAIVVMLGVTNEAATEVAAIVRGLEIVTVASEAVDGVEQSGVSRLLAHGALPLRGSSVRAALIETGVFEGIARDVVRVLAIGGRLVFPAGQPWFEELVEGGVLRVLAQDASHVVTVRVR
jgi:uncharacterized protein YbaR (Trm112 family)